MVLVTPVDIFHPILRYAQALFTTVFLLTDICEQSTVVFLVNIYLRPRIVSSFKIVQKRATRV